MSDLILELTNRRDQLQKNAEIHKKKRDELNDNTKAWARERDTLNKEIRELITKANEHRSKRDNFNEDVQKHKGERDTINTEVADFAAKIMELKKGIAPEKGQIPLGKLKRELRELEFRQQTMTLSPDKEKGLVDRMKQLSQTIKEREEKEQTPEIKKADKAQGNFVNSKMDADKEHNTTMRLVKQIHELEKIIIGLRIKQKYSQKSKKEVDNRMEAKEIFKKFKDGEKLSTDDIMLLQKTGFL